MNKIGRSARSGLGLAVAGAAGAGALALHSWSIMAMGGVAYLTLIAWDLATSNESSKKARASTLPDPKSFRDGATRAAMQTLQNARIQLDRVLAETSDEVKANLAIVLSSVSELETRAGKLAARAEAIGSYLATTDLAAVEQSVRQLEWQASQTGDAEARTHYESARKAREEHRATLIELAQVKERIHASLLTICASVDGLPAKIVRARALDAVAMDELTGTMNEELSRMNDDMNALEETLKTLSEVMA